MPVYKDQIGREVILDKAPQRIISLVPSQTELLFSLGLGRKVVGRTKFCVHPRSEVGKVPVIGGTKDYSLEKVRNLKPDLIIGNKEENSPEPIHELETEFPIFITDVSDLKEALQMIRSVGDITMSSEKAEIITESITESFAHLKPEKKRSALYFIWKNPWMVAGRNTFIHDMMHRAGFMNMATSDRYPALSDEDLFGLDPEVVLLSSEPYPFREKHLPEIRELFPSAEVIPVNGEYFSWYGSRLLEAAGYLKRLH